MKTVGGNNFFPTLRGAKSAATRRGLCDGARILDTQEGFCLLALCEGASNQSYRILNSAPVVSELRNGKWSDF
jgi:hypothetical protein